MSERTPEGIIPLNVWLTIVIPFEVKVELREKRAWVRGRTPTARVPRRAYGDGILPMLTVPPVLQVGGWVGVWK